MFGNIIGLSLHEKCPDTEFFSGSNTGKYGPEKTPHLYTLHALFLNFWGSGFGCENLILLCFLSRNVK